MTLFAEQEEGVAGVSPPQSLTSVYPAVPRQLPAAEALQSSLGRLDLQRAVSSEANGHASSPE